ncbi:MAG: protein YgfX [Betaproteobacteria bacterium]
MRLPPSVHVVLGPSRLVGAAIGVAALATLAIVLALPLPAWQQSALFVLVAGWALLVFRAVALRRGAFAVTELRLAPDLVLVVHMGDGRLVAGHVRSATYVGAWVTGVVWRPDGARWSRAVLIVPDMLPAEDFRRLRVMLRYARSEEAQGAPLNQP